MSDWPAIAVRFALYVDLMLLFGLSSFSLYSLHRDERAAAFEHRPWLAASAALGLLLSALGLAIMAASMAGVALPQLDRESLDAVATGSPIGWAWQVRIAALAAALLVSLPAAPGTIRLVLIALSGGTAVATLAWTGHGASSEGALGWFHLGADLVHLIAAGLWIGALLGLGLLIRRPAQLELSYRAFRGFAVPGSLVVAAILLSGLVNSWMLVGPANIAGLGATIYGRLLLLKLALFAAMLVIAAANRWWLTPRFRAAIDGGDAGHAAGLLRRSLLLETLCAMAILALVAWLGTLAPPAS